MAQSSRTILWCVQNLQHSNTFSQNVLSKVIQQRTLCISSKSHLKCKDVYLHLQNHPLSCNEVLYSGRLSNRCLHMSASSNSRQKTGKGLSSAESEETLSSDKLAEVNTRLSAENGYLSWMRNTYIMTLAGLSMMSSQMASVTPVAGVAAFLCAGMNMTIGSLGFIYNVEMLRRRRIITRLVTIVAQILVVLHLMLWCSILIIFLPDVQQVSEIIDKELDDE